MFGDGMWPFVKIRDGEGAWNDYVFNVLMFFYAVFIFCYAALKIILYLFVAVAVIAVIASLL
jgi:hypothetical protein